jgi:hypothetical protein
MHAAAVPQVVLSSLRFPQIWFSPYAVHVKYMFCHSRLQEQEQLRLLYGEHVRHRAEKVALSSVPHTKYRSESM